MADSLRILGIDPGSRITGYGVIDTNGIRSQYVGCGFLRLADGDLPQRLGEIFLRISEVIVEYRPTVMAIEDVFMSKNAASALKLGQARGAAICAGVSNGLAVAEYAPRKIKQTVSGSGAAEKQQVQRMVAMLLGTTEKLQADAADALAVAVTHAHIGFSQNRLKQRGLKL